MAWQSILDRFRPVGAPGPVGPAGVPALDSTDPRAELAAVFAALRPDVQDAADRVAAAQRSAADVADEARRRCAELAAEARARAPVERAAAARTAQDTAGATGAALMERATLAVRADAERAGRRVPGLVAAAVTLVREHGQERRAG